MSSRNYMFTLFFADDQFGDAEENALSWANNLDEVFSDAIFSYACVNIERAPSTNRVHWQGYVELSRPSRFTYLQSRHPLLATAHFEPRMGTQQEAIAYCSKSDTRIQGLDNPFQYGQPAPGTGHRSDLDSLSELVTSGKSTREIATTMPGMFIRYHHGIAALQAALEEAEPQPDTDFVPRPWQQVVIDTVTQPADDRSIIWITDTQGGQGKTRLATHLILSHGGIELSGKMADMIYAFSRQRGRIVIFDISRAQADFSDHIYSMAEKLKSGRLMNTKYTSRQFTFQPPHVIVFSNSTWDRSKLSLDRVKETTLQPTAAQPAGQPFM